MDLSTTDYVILTAALLIALGLQTVAGAIRKMAEVVETELRRRR